MTSSGIGHSSEGAQRVTSGLALAGAGLLAVCVAVSVFDVLSVIVAELLVGLGTGLSSTPSQVAVMRGVETAQTGAASAMSSTSNQIGASIGSALLNALAVSTTAAYTASHPGAATLTAAAQGYCAAAQLGAILLLAGAALIGMWLNVRTPSSAHASA